MPLAARLIGHQACVTFITVGELARWAEKRRWGSHARTELARWLRQVIVLPYDERVAWQWGQLSVAAERRGRLRPVNDTWIAACCLVADLPLATRNLKDFTDFAEHDGLRVIGVNER
jgi:predicted nucleic acid-binding protein